MRKTTRKYTRKYTRKHTRKHTIKRGGVKKPWQFWKRTYYDAPLTPEDITYAECELCSYPLVSKPGNKLIQLSCGHAFHETDLDYMNNVCPLDRKNFKKRDIILLPNNAYVKEGERNRIYYT
jgi:hypothetical protein